MPPIGAHMSIAGGYYKAVEAAAEVDMNVVQLFCKNNNQWRAKDITDKDVALFQDALAKHNVGAPLCHASYLINLASPKEELWEKSVEGLRVEMLRCEQLGIPNLVFHPGAHMEATLEEGIERIVKAIDELHKLLPDCPVTLLLETTAGQGSSIGHKFEHLQSILEGVQEGERVAVCLDTCHIFAAGYPISDEKDFKATFKDFDKLIGFDKLRGIHLNDSKKDLGSRVDRHDHIGEGKIGVEAFRHMLNDRRFKKIPMYLETPKGEEDGVLNDAKNLATLRSLIK
ncbi:deoxyribonuclease IV [Blastopirellula marina]|uniref:Probable endonuclease 4 n=2 Tax=Pirellulales TaxID=2691354 RepID=A0A2S8FMK2_9BACT|nr:deoxyribonuclease IV [Blastopirellula marina]RCS52496.1 deoxyribonuclease IV [Bremerella cremea]